MVVRMEMRTEMFCPYYLRKKRNVHMNIFQCSSRFKSMKLLLEVVKK